MEDIISNREEMIISNVLSHYPFKARSITRARSAYKIETDNGLVCLKKIRHGKNKAYNGNLLVEELSKKGFTNTAKYIKTTDDKLQIPYKKNIYFCTEWIDGTECDLNNIDEAINCIKVLAKFHATCECMNVDEFNIRSNIKNWPMIFAEALRDIERYRVIIQRKRLKTKFDLMYYEMIDSFYNRGMTALKYLNESSYYKISTEYDKKKIICHDSFYYQNIIKKDDSYFLIDLDSIVFDLKVNDLGKLIRRLMFKKSYQWNYEKAKLLIDAYNSVNKLSSGEIEVMLCLLIFPHKFWKLGRKRYIKNKKWSEAKYTHKLEKIMKYNDLEEEFFNNFIKEQKENSTDIQQ